MLVIARAFARFLTTPLAASDPESAGRADAIVILGAPINEDGSLGAVAEERVAVGVELYRRGLADVVCVTGGHCPYGHRHIEAEAEGMARWVRRAGVPEGALRIDRKASSTYENAQRAAELLLPEGRRRVWLVTQAFHLRRAKYCFRLAGFDPLGWSIEGGYVDKVPRAALRWTLREYAAYALLGGLLLSGRLSPQSRGAN